MTTKDTANGRIIAHCSISTEMMEAADECFLAFKLLNEKTEKFNKTIPEGFQVKSFYGTGDCVIIDSAEEIEKEAKYWEENS